MSFIYGTRSRSALDTVHPSLVYIFEVAITVVNITILEGFRSKERQDFLFETGASKVSWPNSKHNVTWNEGLARAVDFAPYPIDWNDAEKFRNVAFLLRGIALGKGIDLRLGADWDGDLTYRDQTFHDLGHVELL